MASNDKHDERSNRSSSSIIQESGFRVFHGANCGFIACGRSCTHYHCRYCGFGTSQAGNTVTHKRLCTVSQEYSQPGSESGLLLHDSIVRPPQPYPYYSTLPQTSVPTQQSPSQTNSKLVTTQQSAMFNFVIPGQNAQYGGIYGAQNVFPNPSMFSPSNYNYNQLDPWLTQPRLIPPGVHSGTSIQSDVSSTRTHYDKLEPPTSTSSHPCCVNSTTVGMCSPLTAEAYKVVAKELNNFVNKVDSQNWFCNPQSMMNYGVQTTQPSSCKYNDPFHSVSQVSFLLFEQTDSKQEECINVEDICFEPTQNRNDPTRVAKDETLKKTQDTDIKFEFNSSCMQEKVNSSCSETLELNVTDKNMKIVEEKENKCVPMECITETDVIEPLSSTYQARDVEETDEQTQTSVSEESDIVVEESIEEKIDSTEKQATGCCILCHKIPTYRNEFLEVKQDFPLTTTTHVPAFNKLSKVVSVSFVPNGLICKKCLNLVNALDCFEVKTDSIKQQINNVFKTDKVDEEKVEEGLKNDKPSEISNTVDEVTIEDHNLEDPRPFCNICNKMFSSSYYLEKHKQSHTKSYSYYCEHCGKGFAVLNKLESHVSLHENTSQYQCEKCGKQFVQSYDLNTHLKHHLGEYSYNCTFCDKGFTHKETLKVHLRTHTNEKPFVCQFCGKQFTVEANLKTHIQLCSNDVKFSCKKCDKRFVLKSLLQKHIDLKHDNKFRFLCEFCQKGFIKQSDLKKHLKSHSNKKEYKCETCGNCYKTVSSLNHHMKIHTNDKLMCSHCNKLFTSKKVLQDHENSHTGNRPYVCTICLKSFANRINFHVHNKKHNGSFKSKPCPICGQVFKNGLRKEHIRTHQGLKPFDCNKCNRSFTVKGSLNKHVKNKHVLPSS